MNRRIECAHPPDQTGVRAVNPAPSAASCCGARRSSAAALHGASLACALLFSACVGAARPAQQLANHDPLARASAEQLVQQGSRSAAQGDLLRAEQYFSAAIDRGYPAARVLPILMRVCIAGSRLGAALAYAMPYVRQHPEDLRLRYLVAAVQLGLGNATSARAELLRIVAEEPDFAAARYLLATILRDEFGDDRAAAHHFAQHQKLAQNDSHRAEVAAWLRDHQRSESRGRGGPRGPRHAGVAQ